MPLKLKYNHLLFTLALLIGAFTIVFKYKTGSFLSISEKSKKEVIQYELHKRKQDITISSLKASCLDYNFVINKLLNDIDNSKNSCVIKFKKEIEGKSLDSSYFKIVEKIYEYAYYYDENTTTNGHKVIIYQNYNIDCKNYVQLIFINKGKGEESLIKEINNFPAYLSCYCH